ncbi:ATP-dependent metallopeptidase HflB [Ancylostoma caninum]|uniref:ATP-dependent metallopeptidase HflB n=1 Tax=Ancylostoma caninum TaxID=29170 RepID=A0A368GTQ9_ANCCA|nr:ATP-dependent metallopeptidase HflB [Ancylostoma caninum]
MAQVTCAPLRYAEAFARMASMNPAFAIRSRIDVPFWLNREAIVVERRRCAPVQFDDAEEIERGQSVSKSKRMRLSARSSVSSTDSSSMEDSEEERKDKGKRREMPSLDTDDDSEIYNGFLGERDCITDEEIVWNARKSKTMSPVFQYQQFFIPVLMSTVEWCRNVGFEPEDSSSSSFRWSMFADIFGTSKKGKDDPVDGWNQYDSELKKLPEAQQKTYTEGFVKGLLASKGSSSSAPKKSSTLTRFYIFLAACIFIGYLTGVTFDDVRGMDEAKQEVEEIVSYLRDPEKYSRLGGRLPKGVLLVGPPGTGKTLLARAIAGEAQVPFFHTSGSEFDEVLVGQGARRVRDLFDKAKARAPCIIFIDEIDSVGSKRVSNSIHPYANQTINQLLSEMDGFNRNEGVIVIAATNRVDDLDKVLLWLKYVVLRRFYFIKIKALLRPGRFDVRVTVPKPDLAGRTDIFNFYLQRIVHSPGVDPRTLAKGSTGFTGADIENMVNQAALKAATECAPEVTMQHLDEARDRVLMGPARTGGRIPDEEANRNTAYHEAGHTLVSLYTKHATPLHKVTIIPRGQSLGHTAMLPEKDEYQMTKGQLLAALDVMMGGRVAEELVFGDDMVTTGAADDLKKASQLAVQMVKVFGMSDKVGLRDFTAEDSSSTSLVKISDLSPQTAEAIDKEINQVLQDSYQRRCECELLFQKEHQLLAEALLEYETLSADEVRLVISGKKIKRPTPAAARRSNENHPRNPLVHIHILEEGRK